jgi:hypothetical protein
MPRVKLSRDEFDVDALDVEWEESEFADYEGEIPPTGTMLLARVKKAWWTESSNGNSMIKALVVAEGNEDDLEDFNGLPTWDNITFVPSAAFRYGPFLRAMNLTLQDIQGGLYLAEDDDAVGSPIEKIKKWVPGSDDALVTIVIKRDRYQGEWQSKVSKYVAYEEEPEEEEEEEPAPRRRAIRATKAATPARRRTRRAEPEEDEEEEEPEEPEDVEEEEEEEPAPKRRRPAAKSARKPARRSRSRDDEDEPPF